MLTIGIGTMIVLAIVIGVACGFTGYALAQSRQRRAGGGKTSEELRDELESYREDVTEHFQQTAQLVNGMTEQYRAVYEHLANGAQSLCETDGNQTLSLESLSAGLLEEPSDAAIDGRDGAIADDEQEPAAINHQESQGSGGENIGSDNADALQEVESEASDGAPADAGLSGESADESPTEGVAHDDSKKLQ